MDLSSFKTLEFLLDKISAVGLLHSRNFDDIISSKNHRESDGSNTGAINEVSKNTVDLVKLIKENQIVRVLIRYYSVNHYEKLNI